MEFATKNNSILYKEDLLNFEDFNQNAIIY